MKNEMTGSFHFPTPTSFSHVLNFACSCDFQLRSFATYTPLCKAVCLNRGEARCLPFFPGFSLYSWRPWSNLSELTERTGTLCTTIEPHPIPWGVFSGGLLTPEGLLTSQYSPELAFFHSALGDNAVFQHGMRVKSGLNLGFSSCNCVAFWLDPWEVML